MKIEMQNDIGMSIVLGHAAVSRIDGDLRSPTGAVIKSSDTSALLRVDAALVESVRRQGGAFSMTCELSYAGLAFGVLLMRSENRLALLLFDLARQDIIRWLDAAVGQDYLPVVLAAGERAIQVRLPADKRVRELLESGRRCRPADKEEHFSAFSTVLDLLENGDFLRELSIDPDAVGAANVLVLGDIDASEPTDEEQPSDEKTSPMH